MHFNYRICFVSVTTARSEERYRLFLWSFPFGLTANTFN